MSKKMKQILGIYTVAALVTLSLLCAIGYAHLTQLRRMAAYAARSSFETTVRSVDAMGAALQKSLYATDGGLCGSLCGEISASASAAEASLSVLPFDTQELEQLSGVPVPAQVRELRSLPVRHTAWCEKDTMGQAVLRAFEPESCC